MGADEAVVRVTRSEHLAPGLTVGGPARARAATHFNAGGYRGHPCREESGKCIRSLLTPSSSLGISSAKALRMMPSR